MFGKGKHCNQHIFSTLPTYIVLSLCALLLYSMAFLCTKCCQPLLKCIELLHRWSCHVATMSLVVESFPTLLIFIGFFPQCEIIYVYEGQICQQIYLLISHIAKVFLQSEWFIYTKATTIAERHPKLLT